MTTDLRPYPEYKDSDLPWLGRVPAHWRLTTLRRVADVQLSNVDKHSVEGEQPVKLCNYTDVYYHRYIMPGMEFMKATALPREVEKFSLRRGDVLITKDSEDWQDIAVPALVTTDLDGVLCGYHLAHIRPEQGALHGDYLMWAFRSEPVAMQFRVAANGVTRYAVSGPDIKGSSLPLPPIDEQEMIGQFLRDLEHKVRRFIRNRRRLIEVLNEQKQAIINRAVTRGLDPNVPLKPSGIVWLGDIPEHWDVRRIKSLSQVRRGASPRPIHDAKYFDDSGDFAWVRIADVTASERYLERTTQRLSRLGQSKSVEMLPGSLFLSIAGSVGKPIITKIKCCIHDGFVYFPQFHGNTEFLYYVFASGRLYGGLGKLGTQLNLNTDTVGSISIAWPPDDEQAKIVEYLNEALSELNRGTTNAKREIDLIREYRSRLIADVVTGKIDVRHLALPPDSEDLEEMVEELEPLDDAAGKLKDDALAGEVER